GTDSGGGEEGEISGDMGVRDDLTRYDSGARLCPVQRDEMPGAEIKDPGYAAIGLDLYRNVEASPLLACRFLNVSDYCLAKGLDISVFIRCILIIRSRHFLLVVSDVATSRGLFLYVPLTNRARRQAGQDKLGSADQSTNEILRRA